MRQAGQTLEAIATALDRMDVATFRGGKWTTQQVSRVLRRGEGVSQLDLSGCDYAPSLRGNANQLEAERSQRPAKPPTGSKGRDGPYPPPSGRRHRAQSYAEPFGSPNKLSPQGILARVNRVRVLGVERWYRRLLTSRIRPRLQNQEVAIVTVRELLDTLAQCDPLGASRMRHLAIGRPIHPARVPVVISRLGLWQDDFRPRGCRGSFGTPDR